MKRFIPIFIALTLALPSFASAQETRRMELEYIKVTPPCPHVSTVGPSMGVAFSSIGFAVSGPLMAIGGADYNGNGAASPALIGVGAGLAAVSIAGLVTSSIFLHRKRVERRQHEQGRCEMARDPIIPGIRF